jgi:hypothetical protein
MTGLVPAIHVFQRPAEIVDARLKAGHDRRSLFGNQIDSALQQAKMVRCNCGVSRVIEGAE